MRDVLKAPEQANDVARPGFKLDIVPNILDHGPKLAKSWGAFRAFVGVMTALMVFGIRHSARGRIVFWSNFLARSRVRALRSAQEIVGLNFADVN